MCDILIYLVIFFYLRSNYFNKLWSVSTFREESLIELRFKVLDHLHSMEWIASFWQSLSLQVIFQVKEA